MRQSQLSPNTTTTMTTTKTSAARDVSYERNTSLRQSVAHATEIPTTSQVEAKRQLQLVFANANGTGIYTTTTMHPTELCSVAPATSRLRDTATGSPRAESLPLSMYGTSQLQFSKEKSEPPPKQAQHNHNLEWAPGQLYTHSSFNHNSTAQLSNCNTTTKPLVGGARIPRQTRAHTMSRPTTYPVPAT